MSDAHKAEDKGKKIMGKESSSSSAKSSSKDSKKVKKSCSSSSKGDRDNASDILSKLLKTSTKPAETVSKPTQDSPSLGNDAHQSIVTDPNPENLTLQQISNNSLHKTMETFMQSMANQQAQITATMAQLSARLDQIDTQVANNPQPTGQVSEVDHDNSHIDGGDSTTPHDEVENLDELVERIDLGKDDDDQAQGALDRIMSNLHLEYEQEETGQPIKDSLANLVNDMLQKKLSDEKSKEKSDKLLRPRNLELLQPPKVNKEIWNHKKVKAWAKGQDLKYQRTQKLLMKGLIPIISVLDLLLESTEQGLSPQDVINCSSNLLESLTLLTDCNHEMNHRRKDNFRRTLPSNFSNLCTYSREVSQQLFGEDIVKDVKDINETNRLLNTSSRPSTRGRGAAGPAFLGNRRGGRGRAHHSMSRRMHPYGLTAPYQAHPYPHQMPMMAQGPQYQYPRGGGKMRTQRPYKKGPKA